MNSTNLKNALAKSKDIAIDLVGSILARTRLEPIRNASGVEGVKTSWVGDTGENHINVTTDSWNAELKMEGSQPPTLEYIQHGERESLTLRNLKNLSCELDRETLDRLGTSKGAAFAVCAGAAAGLFGWFVISMLRIVSAKATEKTGAPERLPNGNSEKD